MKKAIVTILQLILFLFVFFVGSILPPFHFEHVLIATPGFTRIFVADGISIDVCPLRSYRPRRSPEKASAHLGSVDHSRRYSRRYLRAYDEVRLPNKVGVLGHSCQTNF